MSSSETRSVSDNNRSLNESKIELKEVNYRRDSFDDRFCDDLSEVILQYLPLKYKLRLEGVSKQFQRTVFNKLYELDLDATPIRVIQILDTLAKKSQRLDCLQKVKIFTYYSSALDFSSILSGLKAFPALKTLKLETYLNQCVDCNQIFSFELFKGLSNITHLSLSFKWEDYLKHPILKGIDINLPNLQYLEIIDIFHTSPKGVTQMADILSRLSRLETLKLNFKSGVDFKSIKEQISKKCRKIKEIEIGSVSDNVSDNCQYRFSDNGYYGYGSYYEHDYNSESD